MKLLSGSNTLGIPLSLFLGNSLKHQNNGGELQSVVYIIQMGLSFPVAIHPAHKYMEVALVSMVPVPVQRRTFPLID